MKTKLVRLLTAVVLSFALAAGSTVAVFGVQSGVLVGENNVADMIISVIVPTNLNFTLDPFEIEAEGGNQIVHADYFFINQTNAPVRVSLDITVGLGEGVNLVSDPSWLDRDELLSTDKYIFFAILGADELLPGETDPEDPYADGLPRGVYDAGKDTLIPFDVEGKDASVVFVLGAGSEGLDEDENEDDKTIGAFQFYAELNTYANWAAGDVSVSGTYTIAPLRRSTYDGLFYSGAFTDGGWETQLRHVNANEHAIKDDDIGFENEN